jgi:hypothetical protein
MGCRIVHPEKPCPEPACKHRHGNAGMEALIPVDLVVPWLLA